MYKRSLNNVKMVLFMEQFGLEMTSSSFCAVNNLGLKLLQGDSYDNHVEGVCPLRPTCFFYFWNLLDELTFWVVPAFSNL